MGRVTSLPQRESMEAPALGLISANAGALFVPYALSKGSLTTAIVAEGWQFAGLSSTQTALMIHVIESVSLLFMTLGLVSLYIRVDAKGFLATVSFRIAITGFALTILTHLGEHPLAPFTVPVLTGGTNWFLCGDYLSWLTLYAGLGCTE